MKLNVIMIASLISLAGWGQSSPNLVDEKVDECKKNRGLAHYYIKLEQYEDASFFWLKAFDACGGTENLNEDFFINGNFIYKRLKDSTYKTDAIRQKEVSDSIPWIFEQRLMLAPSPHLELRYAKYLSANNSLDHVKITTLYAAVDSLKAETPAIYLKASFKHLLLNVYNNASSEEKVPLKIKLLNTYFRFTEYANQAILELNLKDSNSAEVKAYDSAKAFLSKYIVRVVKDCDLIQEQMQLQFNSITLKDTALRWGKLGEQMTLMEKFNCTENDVYANYVYASLAIKPSFEGYMGIGNFEAKNENYKKAIEAFNQAIALDSDELKVADANYKLSHAYYSISSYRRAFEFSKKVTGPQKGKAFIIGGNSIAAMANKCGNSTFERKANYWLANDYYLKAAKLGEAVNLKQFSNLWPTTQDCFDEGVGIGETVVLEACWNEETKVR